MNPRPFLGWIFGLVFLLSFANQIVAQMNIGQYEDEAPLSTWNHFGCPTATSLSLGMSQLTFPFDNSIALTNPALLLKLPDITVTLNGSINQASLSQFGLVNTGVLFANENLSQRISALDFGGFSLNYKGWSLAGSVSLIEFYHRPEVELQQQYQGQNYYSLRFSQDGFLRNYNLALARQVRPWLLVGLGINLIRGTWQREVKEEWLISQITIRDYRQETQRGFYINGGITLLWNDNIWTSFSFRTPFKKRASGTSELSYQATFTQTNIRIAATADNSYQMPLILGGGLLWKISPSLLFVSELKYYRWSDYQVYFFEEDLIREFRDTLQAGGGLEYLLSGRFLGSPVEIPLRLGVFYDPQPPPTPHTAYLGYTVGLGFNWPHWQFNLGFNFAQQRGSEANLNFNKLLLTISYFH
ncbi:MAG TPA: hypothetical protein ENF17_08835 [Candidatus Aminicenantes bacterium]|nr:hypothetical protein [Candidatus Aminicenantes bacterium]